MKTYGLTGGIGCGKSTVLQIFKDFGDVLVIKTDDLAKEIMLEPGITKTINAKFGLPGIKLNKPKLAQVVFTDKRKLRWLEDLVHPLVWQRVTDAILTDKQSSFAVVESAIIFEKGYQGRFDGVIAVVCDAKSQKERARLRGDNEESTLERIRLQLKPSELARMADFTIDTSCELEDTKAAVTELYCRLKEEE